MRNWIFIISLLIIACQNTNETNQTPTIVCTTGMIKDMVQQIVDDKVDVIGLMGPGVDPHLYKATSQDIQNLKNAKAIVYNGLHLEGKMQNVLESMSANHPIHAIGDHIPQNLLIKNSAFAGTHDPHIWFDVHIWMEATKSTIAFLTQTFPEHQAAFQVNGEKYLQELSDLDQWIKDQMNQLPVNQRHLVTAHDAFEYYGKAYQINVRGLQGISTVTEFGIKDVTELVNFLKENEVKSIFIESSISDRSLRKVIEASESVGHQVKIGGELFSDAMGPANTPEGTYIGMVKHNTNTIVKGLK